MATTINTIGLGFNIIGAIILYKFGLPPRIDLEGHIHFIAEQVDEAEITLGKRYRCLSNVAVGLLILGFATQLVSNYLH